MANVLLVDTNFSSGPILNFLHGLGHSVYFCGGNPNDYLAKATPGYVQLDYSDPQALLELCNTLSIDHLVPGCNDRSYYSCAAVSEQREFHNIDSLSTTETLNHKAKFRAFAHREGLSVPRLFSSQLTQVPSVPLVIKPVDAFSGKGITVLHDANPASLQAAIDQAQAVSKSGDCVVEEFVHGQLYSHSAFIEGGKIIRDFVVVEHGSANPFVVDTSHIASDFPTRVLLAMRQEIAHLAQRLSLKDGLLHSQFILQNEQFYWIEMTRRCPGDLYSQLIELSTGFPYAASYAMPFLGLKVQPHAVEAHCIMRHTLTLPNHGLLEHLKFHQPLCMERWVPLCSTGEKIQPSPASRMALLFARCKTPGELRTLTAATCARQLYTFNG